jgi:rod shape-determining protein MreD
VLLVVVTMQAALGQRLVVAGASADLVLLLAVAAGIVGGPEEGALVGFIAGLMWDLAVVQTPLGLSSLTFAAAGFGVGNLQGSVLGATWWTPMVSAGVASGAAVSLYAAVGVLLGNTEWVGTHTLAVVLVVTLVNGLLSPLAIAVMHWVEGGGLPSLPGRTGTGGSGRRGPRARPFARLRLPSLPVGRRAPKMGRRPPTLWRTAGGPSLAQPQAAQPSSVR